MDISTLLIVLLSITSVTSTVFFWSSLSRCRQLQADLDEERRRHVGYASETEEEVFELTTRLALERSRADAYLAILREPTQ